MISYKMTTYRLELVVEPWALPYYKNEPIRNNDNAGYDLYCEKAEVVTSTLINQGVRARMVRVAKSSAPYSQGHYLNALFEDKKEGGSPKVVEAQEEVHYYLVPRSSICKTPLIMSNSTGIIDRTYRGLIKAPVRNLGSADYHVTEGTRLFQITAPDLGHISEVRIVQSLPETQRGEGGFGSTGK